MQRTPAPLSDAALVHALQALGQRHGLSQIGVTGVDLSAAEPGLLQWLASGFAGDMHYMVRHGALRARPAELVPGSLSIVSARLDYLPRQSVTDGSAGDWRQLEWQRLHNPAQATVSMYARGRDYHRVLRSRLAALAADLQANLPVWLGTPAGSVRTRAFTDSAPVLEVELAQRSGLGWRGKHTLALSRQAGSLFFLGEVFVNQRLPATNPVSDHCGACTACIDVCPTQAIVAPYRLDARRCISYLTIEHAGPIAPELRPAMGNRIYGCDDCLAVCPWNKFASATREMKLAARDDLRAPGIVELRSSIPVEFRKAMGNRIYGCDDCQLVCPWNKFANVSPLPDFDERSAISPRTLVQLFAWDEATFLRHTEGSAIRRIGHERWLRNIAVALGNALAATPAPADAPLRHALAARMDHASALVREHVAWALAQGPKTPAPSP
jgi:epoxyqueuosine reductase